MAFADRFRKRQGLSAITGYSGGSLQDQLDEDPQQPTGQMLTAANTAAITRPRVVSPFVNRLMNQPAPAQPNEFAGPSVPQPAQPQGSVATNQPMPDDVSAATRPRMANPNPFLDRLMNNPSMQERSREVNPEDTITKDVGYLRQLQSQPDTWRDKAGLIAQSISRNLGGQPLPTRKQHEEEKAGQALTQDMAIQRQQILNQQGMMVPVYDNQGNVIGSAPARTAAGTQIRQNLGQRGQDIKQQRVDELGTSDALGRYNSLKHYKQGEDDSLDAYFARYFPNGLPEKDEAKTKETFDIRMINGQLYRTPRTAEGVSQPVQGAPIDQTQVPVSVQGPQGNVMVRPSTAATITAGNTRQQTGIQATNDRQQTGIAATRQNMGNPEQMYAKASQDWDTAQALRRNAEDMGSREKRQALSQAAKIENDVRKTQQQADRIKAVQGTPTAPQSGNPYAGKSWSLGSWNAKNPSATDEQRAAAVAKARNAQMKIID